ncbi:MAG: hypothetical protein AAFY76_20205 [Cyanobacteria bacterium J06649_11]
MLVHCKLTIVTEQGVTAHLQLILMKTSTDVIVFQVIYLFLFIHASTIARLEWMIVTILQPSVWLHLVLAQTLHVSANLAILE